MIYMYETDVNVIHIYLYWILVISHMQAGESLTLFDVEFFALTVILIAHVPSSSQF